MDRQIKSKARGSARLAAVLCAVALFALCLAAVSAAGFLPADRSAPATSPAGVSPTGVSESDAVSAANVVYYPIVHIDGLTLPERYGDGLFDAYAAMWLINEYRAQNGLYGLFTIDGELARVADLRLSEIIENFSHDRPDGSRFYTVYDQLGCAYTYCGENLAYGQYTAEEVVRDWIESESHRAILLADNVSSMRVATALDSEGVPYWVLETRSAAG